MSDEQWIVVPNWDRFQHYKDRVPSWIKVYEELLHDPDFDQLTLAERGLLLTIWLQYAGSRGQLRRDLVNTWTRGRQWDSLLQAGFIEVSASRPLALARSREKSTSYLREEKNARARELAPSSSPARASKDEKPGDYQRAANMVRNGGWQYEPQEFQAELDRLGLTDLQRYELEQLRLSLNGHQDEELF